MKYVHWPPTATSGDFVIGVIGDKNVYNTLTQWYGTKSKGAQKIIIKQFKSVAELTDCHVLYVARSKSGSFGDLKVALKGKPTLLITDKMGMGKKGSGINFKTVESKLKFELNQEAIASANLKVASQLTGMAIIFDVSYNGAFLENNRAIWLPQRVLFAAECLQSGLFIMIIPVNRLV